MRMWQSGVSVEDARHEGHPVAVGEADVEDHHVGAMLGHEREGLFAGLRRPDDGDVAGPAGALP